MAFLTHDSSSKMARKKVITWKNSAQKYKKSMQKCKKIMQKCKKACKSSKKNMQKHALFFFSNMVCSYLL